MIACSIFLLGGVALAAFTFGFFAMAALAAAGDADRDTGAK